MSVDADIETDTVRIRQQQPPYPRDEEELLTRLIDISEELSSEDLKVLKFLCYDIISASKLENVDSALSIFENLKKNNKLTHMKVDILLECLWFMHRKDLIRKLGFDPKEVEKFIPGLNGILPFRKLLLKLQESITAKEFRTLQFYLDGKVKKKKLQDKKNMLQLFVFLEQEGLISHDKPEPLITLMNVIKRADLTLAIEEHFGNEDPIMNREPAQLMGTVSDPVVLLPGNPNMENISRQMQELCMNRGTVNTESQITPLNPMYPVETTAMGQGQSGPYSQMEEDFGSMEESSYPMNASPKGICVIINNRNFIDPQLQDRIGTDLDVANLQDVFTKLDFMVKTWVNLTDTGMMQVLVDIAHNTDHRNYHCFVCCILTHGVLGYLYGTNGERVLIKDLTSVFQANRCPSLAGKPKLFFLQACQGKARMGGGEVENDAAVFGSRSQNVETDDAKEVIPNEADFLIGYATVPGYVSFRSRTKGSWYIRKLCELLEKYSERDDVLSILIRVNDEVSRGDARFEDSIFKQMPAPLFTLRKKVYFSPPNRRAR